ncbi:MAG: helix-turn-helix transcriptional regulator [Fusobacteriaceae bacterium]|jgi:predicted transcriptional regulator YheO|nr:helix-turn-helix transcriptional regulator [Fusobacteriaceae bacterium]
MKTIDEEMEFFKNLMQLLKAQFGDETEIVLHDWSKGYDRSIVAIENNHITGRNIGDCGSNLGLEVIKGTETKDLKTNYVTKTKDGKTLMSSTMYLKNDQGHFIGALCVNSDVTKTMKIRDYLDSKLPDSNARTSEEFFATNVSDLLTYLINGSLEIVGKPVAEMTREDKIRALRYLDEKGALLISKSNTKICNVFGISKFTLYNYLDEIHENREKF